MKKSELEKNSKKLENNIGELDCISRKRAIERLKLNMPISDGTDNSRDRHRYMQSLADIQAIRELPPVTPEPRIGHWEHGKELSKEYRGRILVDVTYADWHCSNCNYVIKGTDKPKWNYCPNCGAKMVEPQESEET